MRSNDRDTLTAVLLYMVSCTIFPPVHTCSPCLQISIKPDVDHRSLSTLLGTVIRIAQRLGIDSEVQNVKHDAFEAEMRRRLWWALVLFDRRVCEASHNLRLSALTPTWSCQLPANINDFELRPGMKAPPQAYDRPTEATNIIVRSTIAQRLQYSPSQMDFVNPMLKPLARSVPSGAAEEGDDLTVLENLIATKPLSDFNLEDPLQFVTVWSARSELAEARLWKYYWIISKSARRSTDAQRDAAMSHALKVIECEAKLSTSPHAKRYRWYIAHFPFAAYIHVIQELKVRPHQKLAARAWSVLNDDFMDRFGNVPLQGHPIFALLAKVFIQAWEAREPGTPARETSSGPPVVAEMRRIAEPVGASNKSSVKPPENNAGILDGFDLQDFLPVPTDIQGFDAAHLTATWPDLNSTGNALNEMDWLGFGVQEST